jgi:anti-sigma B factor antagonist
MIIDHDLTIYTAAEIKSKLLDAVAASTSPGIDLSRVAEIDGAGLQLLMLAQREAARLGRRLALVGIGPAVKDVLTLAGGFDTELAAATHASSGGDAGRGDAA